MKEKRHKNKDEVTKNKVKDDDDSIISYNISIYNKDENIVKESKSDLSEFDLILKKIMKIGNKEYNLYL